MDRFSRKYLFFCTFSPLAHIFAKLRENLCFRESFRENMRKTGANTRGRMKNCAVYEEMYLLSQQFLR
jgi:hypothetical protein